MQVGALALKKDWSSKLYTGVCDILGGHRPPEGAVPWANSTSLPEPSQNAVQPAPGKSSSLLNTSELVDPEDNLSPLSSTQKRGDEGTSLSWGSVQPFCLLWWPYLVCPVFWTRARAPTWVSSAVSRKLAPPPTPALLECSTYSQAPASGIH